MVTPVKIISPKYDGRFLELQDQEGAAVVLGGEDATKREALRLRFAFRLLGHERLFLPGLALDDWGREIQNLALYRWFHLEGDRYPRAELFGYAQEPSGAWVEAQYFVRDFEMTALWPVLAVRESVAAAGDGQPVVAIGWEQAGRTTPRRIDRPAGLKLPLARADVTWWEFPVGVSRLDKI